MSSPPTTVPRPGAERVLDDRGFRSLLRRATTNLLMVLVIPVLVLLGLVLFLLRSAHWIEHSDLVISEANSVEKLTLTMQSGFRGYRLTGDRASLTSYRDAQNQVGGHMQILENAVTDNPRQGAAVAALRVALAEWIKTADASIARIASGQSGEAQIPYMDATRTAYGAPVPIVSTFLDDEQRLRSERSRTFAREVVTTMAILGAATLLGVPLLAWWLQKRLKVVESWYAASLTASERRAIELQVTLGSIGDAVIATDRDGNISLLNRAAQGLTGWMSRDAAGMELARVYRIFDEESGRPVANPVARVLRDNAVIGFSDSIVLRSKDGRERPIEHSAAPIRSEAGSTLGVILVFRDVKEKRTSEQILRDSEKRLRFLQGLADATRDLTLPAAIMKASTEILGRHLAATRCAYADVEDDHNHFTIHNDYADGCPSLEGRYQLSQFGARITSDLSTGKTVVINDVDREPAYAESAAALGALNVRAMICYPLMKEGALTAMMAVHQNAARPWTATEIALVIEVVERSWATIARARAEADALERRRAAEAEALASIESANRFRLLSEVVALQVWTALDTGALDYANQECIQYFGGDLSRDILGNAWVQYVHLDDLPKALESWKESLTTGKPYEVEFRLRGTNGKHRWFITRARALRDGQNRIVKWFGTNTDIDDLKRARDTAERASRAKDDFLAALSHELRTPLTPVLLTVSELREDQSLPAEMQEQLGMMERNIALEARLIDDLLDLTTISKGKLQMHAQPCDAHALIVLAVDIVRTDAVAKEISIERDLQATLSSIVADPTRFQQVIWNLLRNAVKFTPKGGKITIRTSNPAAAEGPWLRIEVIDSGIGFDPAMGERIFLPFDQGELTKEHRFGGVGLGLSIARAIVELHNGRIAAQSAGADQGATFTVDLPGAPGAEAGPKGSDGGNGASTKAATGTAPLRLLIVDDHENTLKSLQQLLRRRGHDVVTAGSVSDALAAASKATFDLVISDLGLPDGTGTELMEKLRDTYGLRGIALSGYGLEDDLIRTRKAGFVAHLVKPVQFAELHKIITSLPRS